MEDRIGRSDFSPCMAEHLGRPDLDAFDSVRSFLRGGWQDRVRSVLVVVLLLASLSNRARAADLLNVLDDAALNDAIILEAQEARLASLESRPQAIGTLLPQVGASGSIERDRITGITEQPQQFGNEVVVFRSSGEQKPVTTEWAVTIRQSVFSWANWVALKNASRSIAKAEADYQAAEQDLISRTVQSYFAVLQASNTLDSDLASQEALQLDFDNANMRYDAGLVPLTDVKEAAAARDSATADAIQARRVLSAAEEALRATTGKTYESLGCPSENMELTPPQPADVTQWVNQSKEHNLTLISSRLAAEIAHDDVLSSSAGHLPTVDLLLSKARSKQNSTEIFDPNSLAQASQTVLQYSNLTNEETFSIQATVPIFSGGAVRSRVRESQHQLEAARARTSQVSRDTEKLARDSYFGVISGIARVRALRQATVSSEAAFEVTQSGYDAGTRTEAEVLDSRKSLALAQTDYANSRFDYLNSVVQLQLAAGLLDRRAVAELNTLLTERQVPHSF